MAMNMNEMGSWPLQEAKAHFSELIRQCNRKGPQMVTVRGHEEAVVMSVETYKELLHPKPSFIDFLDSSPLKGIDLDITRDTSLNRETDL